MSVKNTFTVFKGLNTSSLCFTGACLLIVISILIFRVPNEKSIGKQTHLAVRSIGDELLKSSGDLSTPVPPVQRINSETFLLSFHIPIAIQPDSLANLSLKYLSAEIAGNLIVNVLDADTKEVVYGFEIDHIKNKDIPCLGRTLPESNYLIEVSLYSDKKIMIIYSNVPAVSTISASILIALLGLIFVKKKNPSSGRNQEIEWNGIRLDIEHNRINTNHERIGLTEKETQILAILFEYAGNLVSREFFLQQIWFKEGVITDRSLDMYISRLRKKMKVLPNVEIVNQHGKGYYLKYTDVS